MASKLLPLASTGKASGTLVSTICAPLSAFAIVRLRLVPTFHLDIAHIDVGAAMDTGLNGTALAGWKLQLPLALFAGNLDWRIIVSRIGLFRAAALVALKNRLCAGEI